MSQKMRCTVCGMEVIDDPYMNRPDAAFYDNFKSPQWDVRKPTPPADKQKWTLYEVVRCRQHTGEPDPENPRGVFLSLP